MVSGFRSILCECFRGSGCLVCIMDKLYNYVEAAVINYKLDSCCWAAPVRIGIYIIAYCNVVMDCISMVGIANESFSPTLLKVQEIILPDNVSKPIPLLAYATELSFTMILLCGMYRNDRSLLQVYMYYVIAAVIMAILVYSMVIAAIDVLVTMMILISIMLEIYMLILVWSINVELRDATQKNGDVKVVYNAVDQEIKEMTMKSDVETPAETAASDETEEKKHRDTKLETVDEEPKES